MAGASGKAMVCALWVTCSSVSAALKGSAHNRGRPSHTWGWEAHSFKWGIMRIRVTQDKTPVCVCCPARVGTAQIWILRWMPACGELRGGEGAFQWGAGLCARAHWVWESVSGQSRLCPVDSAPHTAAMLCSSPSRFTELRTPKSLTSTTIYRIRNGN